MKKLELSGFPYDKEAGDLEMAMYRLENKAKKLSQAFAGIWDGGGAALKNLSAQLEQTLKKAASTGGKLRRSLAGFDQLERLAAPVGGSGTSGQAQKSLTVLQQLKDAGASLRERVLEPISGWFRETFPQLLAQTDQGTQVTVRYAESWGTVAGYLSKWSTLTTQCVPATDLLSKVLQRSGLAAQGVGADLEVATQKGHWFTEAMQRIREASANSAQGIRDAWSGSGTWFQEQVSVPVEEALGGLWSGIRVRARESWEHVREIFGSAGSAMFSSLSQAWEGVKSTFSDKSQVATEMESGVLSGFREAANRVIDGINGVVSTPFSGLNRILEKLKSFKIGKLQPFQGLDFFIQTPKIPRLAQGAVIPPNREFLAVLGDQHHGTNIEAPLSTIQEAVAITMEDMIASNTAGHQATVDLLREILQAVLGVSIGEDALSSAVSRYNAKLAVMRGGVL